MLKCSEFRYNKQVMTCWVDSFDLQSTIISAVYASSEIGERQLWEYLNNLNVAEKEWWFVGGDFNVVADSSEKLGRLPPNRKAIREFIDFQQKVKLQDMGYEGPIHTWCNGNPKDLVWERLDRILASSNAALHSNMKVKHELRLFSDHSPLVCMVDERQNI